MVAILEPRISGKKVDDFILKNGFDRSHKIEAIGFLVEFSFFGKESLLWLTISCLFISRSLIF